MLFSHIGKGLFHILKKDVPRREEQGGTWTLY